MPDLLTAKDVELKMFKKASFGGYAISDVEEFMNQVAEDLEAYALRQSESQRRIYYLEEALKRHEEMKDTINDALILAQKSAKDKEGEAMRQADMILAKAQAQLHEIDAQARRRTEEAENSADEIIAMARSTAAQIIQDAESMKEETQKRLLSLDVDIAQRMADANDKANEIVASARIEARSVIGKIQHETEELKREIDSLRMERHRLLRNSGELAAAFIHMLDEANQKIERESLPSSPVTDDADEQDIS